MRGLIRGLFDQFADMAWWCAAVVMGAAPRRVWHRLEQTLPLRRAAFFSALLTMAIGFFAGFDGFLKFGSQTADANNAWMLRMISTNASEAQNNAIALVPYGFSLVSMF